MSLFQEKLTELVGEAEKIMEIVENNPDLFTLLRTYNKWYTKGIEFVSKHARDRKRYELVYFDISLQPINTLIQAFPTMDIIRL